MNNSYALPARRYGNPADIVEYDQMDALGCRACKKHNVVLAKSLCTDSRNTVQKDVPIIGHHCKWFNEKGL
jgi:hypothetical protein